MSQKDRGDFPGGASRRRIRQKLAAAARWLHIYTSVLGLAAVLFFSVTGLTLNHPDWLLGSRQQEQTFHGVLKSQWLAGESLDRLAIVEFLRKEHGLHGGVEEFHEDDPECSIGFKGPGYSADVFFDRHTGKYEVTAVSEGWVAVLNDFHKGRHTGGSWSLVIDIIAILLVVISLTGLILLFFIKRRRVAGLIVALAGIVVIMVIARWLVE